MSVRSAVFILATSAGFAHATRSPHMIEPNLSCGLYRVRARLGQNAQRQQILRFRSASTSPMELIVTGLPPVATYTWRHLQIDGIVRVETPIDGHLRPVVQWVEGQPSPTVSEETILLKESTACAR